MQYDDIDRPGEMESLARTSLDLTKRGKIRWSVTDDENSFLYSSAKSGLLIEGSPAPEPDIGEYSLKLVNNQGQTVADFNNEIDSEENDWPRSRLLSELWFEARSSALEVESTFLDIRNALGVELGNPE